MSSVKQRPITFVAGVDCSTFKIAVVILNDERKVLSAVELVATGETKERVQSLMRQFSQRLGVDPYWLGARWWAVEDVGFVRGGRTTILLAEVVGAVRGALETARRNTYLVHPMTWKSKVGVKGSGQEAKESSRRIARSKLGFRTRSDDLSDASLVALAMLIEHPSGSARREVREADHSPYSPRTVVKRLRKIEALGGVCMDCAMNMIENYYCAQFDHIDGKSNSDREELVCANCHAKRTVSRTTFSDPGGLVGRWS
jgi:Holliday junction resolvasome RuvABC endonuclease subunit